MPDKFTQIRNDLIRSSTLTPKERSVLFVLISYAGCEEIFIGQKKLAELSGMKRKSVIDAVKGLNKKGLLKTRIKPDRSTLLYQLDNKAVVSKSDNVVSKLDRGCVKMTQGVVSKLDTSNKSISNKSISNKRLVIKEIKKEKKNETELPEWLDKKAWLEFVEFRKEKKKPLTKIAIKRLLSFLEKHKADQSEIIDVSIRSGWTGLFPLKETKKNKPVKSRYRMD